MNESLNKEILRLAVPNVLSNISIPLLSAVDTILMGHLSSSHLGAVGIGSMIFNFLYWNFGFLRMGTTGLTAQAFGASNEKKITLSFYRSIILAAVISVLLILLSIPIGEMALKLMQVQVEQTDLIRDYFFIRILAAPASLMMYAILGWLFGMQNAWYPLWITISINVVNIALSAFLVLQLNMAIRGVAIGTLVAQYVGLVFCFILLLNKYKGQLAWPKWKDIIDWKELRLFFNINKDIFIRTVCLSCAFAFLYSQSSAFGPEILAANIVLLQFLNWMSYGIDGIAYASESLVGKYKGSGNQKKTHQAVIYCFYWGFGLAFLFSLVYGIFGESIISLFTNQANVIVIAKSNIMWMILVPLVAAIAYMWDGIFIGLTASKAMRNSMLISFAIYLACFYFSKPYISEQSIWLSLVVFLLVRGIIQSYLYYKKSWLLA